MSKIDHLNEGEIFSRIYPDEGNGDVQMENSNGEQDGDQLDRHFIVAVDFGTTFSSVAFIATNRHSATATGDPDRKRTVDADQIESIGAYPDQETGRYEDAREVPTESWYPNVVHRSNFIAFGPMDGGLDYSADEGQANISSGRASPQLEASESDPMDEAPDNDDSEDYIWGYGVQGQLRIPDIDCDKSRRVWRSKLILDTSKHTAEIREELEETFQNLKRMKLISQSTDVISDYLQRLFQHVKKELEISYKFQPTSTVEFVLCVPVIWTARASRIMQAAMATAINNSGFSKLECGSISNLFIVSEPEAAAACLLTNNNDIKPCDTFVLIDAGGGTVDAITYTVDKTHPLRIKSEAFPPAGALYGSSFLNAKFEKILLRRLKDEKYLEKNGRTIQRIVDAEVVQFENTLKRRIDVNNKTAKIPPIVIHDLRQNAEKRFGQNRLYLSRKEIDEIYMPCFEGIADLMMTQLSLAKDNGLVVKKVLLIGGFAASRSLVQYLRNVLDTLVEFQTRRIELLNPGAPITAVARGAVLRALWKTDGPDRVILSSYGFLRDEPWEPECVEAHREVRGWFDKLNGEMWVKKTIEWLIKKGDKIPSHEKFRIPTSHTFSLTAPQLLCEEILYVADASHESHYRRSHPKNTGAEIAGTIVVDMTFLKTEGKITPVIPGEGELGQKHYRVDFDLVMIVDGRNLRYEARYPSGETGQVIRQGLASIAAAFIPGTN